MDAAHRQVFKEFIKDLRAVHPVSKDWQNHVTMMEITPALQTTFSGKGLALVAGFLPPIAKPVFEHYSAVLTELEGER